MSDKGELIKNFARVREYMREFYLHGFKSREEYANNGKKSARTYDNILRRIKSWLPDPDYTSSYRRPDGKVFYISIDSRTSHRNPLHAVWKTKSFTNIDIALHFMILDVLNSSGAPLDAESIADRISTYSAIEAPSIDAIKIKLKEYSDSGLIDVERRGKRILYKRSDGDVPVLYDAVEFFSETSPCGVIGSFLLDREEKQSERFAFKRHYITSTIDSEIVYMLLNAMSGKEFVILRSLNREKNREQENRVVPLRIMIGVQNGRQYLMAYSVKTKNIAAFRIDNVISVKPGGACKEFDEYRKELDRISSHMWGVNTPGKYGQTKMEHVGFTVKCGAEERHIYERLEREKRCGRVEVLGNNAYRFEADIYDLGEMIPWIRTFTGRITDISFSSKKIEEEYKNDLAKMYYAYGLEGGGSQ